MYICMNTQYYTCTSLGMWSKYDEWKKFEEGIIGVNKNERWKEAEKPTDVPSYWAVLSFLRSEKNIQIFT